MVSSLKLTETEEEDEEEAEARVGIWNRPLSEGKDSQFRGGRYGSSTFNFSRSEARLVATAIVPLPISHFLTQLYYLYNIIVDIVVTENIKSFLDIFTFAIDRKKMRISNGLIRKIQIVSSLPYSQAQCLGKTHKF